ncbi:uracil phosphoribosyltransferase [Peptococcaceae bacterium 1198_IL3148]
MKNVTVVKHPVAKHCLRYLRDKNTDIVIFRDHLNRLGTFLAMEATTDIPTKQIQVDTPLNIATEATEAMDDNVLLVPILRAGLGFVESFLKVIPRAKVAHVGMARDHETLEAKVYLSTLPDHVSTFDKVYVLDPMLATGNSCVKALEILVEAGIKPENIVVSCAFSVEEGIRQVHSKFPEIRIVTATVDQKLNEVGYIVPGCGDAGDRLYLL